jgi:hypothetical protein
MEKVTSVRTIELIYLFYFRIFKSDNTLGGTQGLGESKALTDCRARSDLWGRWLFTVSAVKALFYTCQPTICRHCRNADTPPHAKARA